MTDVCAGRSRLWWEPLQVRAYERAVYGLVALMGASWGGFAVGLFFQFPPSSAPGGVLSWIFLWPAWLDLWFFRSEVVVSPALQSDAWLLSQAAIIGAIGGCAAAYGALTVTHLRE